MNILLPGLLLACAATTVLAQSAPVRVDVASLGPKVGERIADFRLADQDGKPWTRESVMGPKGLMLVFSRSADWCPFCKTQLVELQARLPELRRKGLGLAAITYDSPAILADFARRRGVTFPMLSDRGSATIKAFGLLNTTVDPGSTNYGIPFPGTFIVDRQGIVTARFFEEAYQERNTVASILLKLGAAGQGTDAQRITTDHAEITTYLTDQAAAPGTLFSIVVDVEPRKGMHLYAPGKHNYKVIALRLDAHPLVVVRPLRYPASETVRLQAAQRTCRGVPAAVPVGPGRWAERVARGAKGAGLDDVVVDVRHIGIPGVRRQDVLSLQVGAGGVHRQRAAVGRRAGARGETELACARPVVETEAASLAGDRLA